MAIIKGSYAPINVTGGVDINNKIKITEPPKPVEPAESGVIKLTEADEQKLYSVFMGEDFGGSDFASWEEEVEEEKPEPKKPEPAPEPKKDSKESDEAINRLAEQIIYDAREQAKIIIAEARQQADAVRNESHAEQAAIEADCRRKVDEAEKYIADIKLEAKNQGYSQGREEGLKKGGEEGYIQGLKKCHETLLELKKLNEDIVESRNSLIQNYERQVFDLVFAIAQKITVDSLKQKDKKVIEKMIKEASKDMRKAKNIRVTLSKLDLSEDMEADFASLSKLFADGVNVEFEVLSDAESGTLILDDGSKIIDAGVSTQLRMIKELGSGKYRDAAPEEDYEPQQEELAFEEEPVKADDTAELIAEEKPVREEAAEQATTPTRQAAEQATVPTRQAAEQAPAPTAMQAEEKPAEKKTASRKRKAPTNPLLSKMLGELTED